MRRKTQYTRSECVRVYFVYVYQCVNMNTNNDGFDMVFAICL